MTAQPGVPVPELPLPERLTVLPRLRADALGTFEFLRRRHGPIFRMDLGGGPVVLISHPAWVEEVLFGRAADVKKDQIVQSLRLVIGDGLLTSEGDTWRSHRRRIAPSFQRSALEGYAATMVAHSKDAAASHRPGELGDVHHDLMALTLRIVVSCLFGTDADLSGAGIDRALDQFMHRFVVELRTWRRVAPTALLWFGRRPYRRAMATFDSSFSTIIAAHRARGTDGDDLLSRLLAARDEDGSGFTDQELRDELLTLLVAGHETTALALTYALAMLSRAPDDQARARAEIDAVLGDRDPTAADLPNLPFLRAIVSETLRLYPPAWGTGREVVNPFKLGPWQLKVGDQATVLPWLLHRDPTLWEDPLVFKPERWLDGLEKRLPKGQYFPFGLGPRACVGNHFAMMEMVIVLAVLLRQWRVLPGGPLPKLLAAVTLRPLGPVAIRWEPAR